jgi:allantoinase
VVIADLVVRGDAWDVAVRDGVIVAIGPELAGGTREIDARGHLVMPGAIDPHVHLNDPGRAHWEGFGTGTRALAAGGVTCAIDMPLNALPPTLDAAAFDAKVDAARGRAVVDFALWGGLVPGPLARMDELAERGVVGFKAFMCPSGVDEFPAVDADALGRGMERSAALGLPVAVHAEDPSITEPLAARSIAQGRRAMRDWRASRPVRAETAAVATALELAEQTGCALHIVHLSSADAVDLVVGARARGVDVTCETCPHYLVLDAGDADRIGAVAKSAPPLRSSAEREALWGRLMAGDLDMIASDHSPGPPEMKEGHDMFAVWGGISGAQTTVPLALTHGLRRGATTSRLVDLLCTNAAGRFGLPGKGRLAVGADADIAIVRLDDPWRLRAEDLEYHHRHSVFVGGLLHARVVRTILRGVTVFGEGATAAPPAGRLVTCARAGAR